MSNNYKYFYQIDFIDNEGNANFIDTLSTKQEGIKNVNILNEANRCLYKNTKYVLDKYRYKEDNEDEVELIEENITKALTVEEYLKTVSMEVDK